MQTPHNQGGSTNHNRQQPPKAEQLFDSEGFLALRELEFYFGPPGTAAADQGVEHIAEIIAWGPMDENTTIPGPAYPSQPVAEYAPQLPGLPNSGIEELHEAFVYLTGMDPLHSDGNPEDGV